MMVGGVVGDEIFGKVYEYEWKMVRGEKMMRYVRQGYRWWRGGFVILKRIRELD
jgi:hypothetical protein